MITIDNREKGLIALFHKNQNTIATIATIATIPFAVDVLPVGDITMETSTVKYYFERKTIQDLLASIRDGRFREQKARLNSLHSSNQSNGESQPSQPSQPVHLSYIIENGPVRFNHSWDKSCLSAVINTVFRDKMSIFFTKDCEDTYDLLIEIWTRVKDYEGVPQRPDYIASLNNSINCKRSANIDSPETCLILQLSQIPGISTSIAQTIIENIKTQLSETRLSMKQMLDFLSAKENPLKYLTSIPKIGSKKGETIARFLGL